MIRGGRLVAGCVLGLLCGALIAVLPAWGSTAAETQTQTFGFTDGTQTFTVPSGVTSITVTAVGGGGGPASSAGLTNLGGDGGQATASIKVTPGQTLYVMVGGAGSDAGTPGYNGGGDAGAVSTGIANSGGGGGGASDVQTVSNSDDPGIGLVVAGGGGGAGGYGIYNGIGGYGGVGGGLLGAADGQDGSGNDSTAGGGGSAAGSSSAGNGGTAAYTCFDHTLTIPTGDALYACGEVGDNGTAGDGLGGDGGEVDSWPPVDGVAAQAAGGTGGGGGAGYAGGGGGGGGAALCTAGTTPCSSGYDNPTLSVAGEAGGGGGGGEGSSYAPGGSIGTASSWGNGSVTLSWTGGTSTTDTGDTGTSTTGTPSKTGQPGVGTPDVSGSNPGTIKITVPLRCKGASGTSCKLTAAVSAREKLHNGKVTAVMASATSKASERTVTIASKSITLSAGKAKTLKTTLNAAGKKLIRDQHAFTALLTVRQAVGDGKSKTIASHKLKLRIA